MWRAPTSAHKSQTSKSKRQRNLEWNRTDLPVGPGSFFGVWPFGVGIFPMSDFAIDVSGITKKFGAKTVVNGIDLQVRRGEIYGFLGPNGSGKTTFIRMLCGLLTPDGGRGTCLGYDVLTQQSDIKRHVGYMTQRFSYYEDLSIRENLDFVARLYDVPDRV